MKKIFAMVTLVTIIATFVAAIGEVTIPKWMSERIFYREEFSNEEIDWPGDPEATEHSLEEFTSRNPAYRGFIRTDYYTDGRIMCYVIITDEAGENLVKGIDLSKLLDNAYIDEVLFNIGVY